MSLLGKVASARRKVSENTKTFTEEDFFEYQPQFQTIVKQTINGKEVETKKSLLPERVLASFINMGNKNILEDVWNDRWEYACSL